MDFAFSCLFIYPFTVFESDSVSESSNTSSVTMSQKMVLHCCLCLINLPFYPRLAGWPACLSALQDEVRSSQWPQCFAQPSIEVHCLPCSSLLNSATTKFADLLGSVRRGSGPTSDGEGRSSTPPPAAFSAPSPPHTPVVPMQSK